MISSCPDFLVSIQCMTYNHASYIEDAMNGFCMQQTTFPYVAIIVDDASTDGEPEVIRSYLSDHFDMEYAKQWETDDAHFVYAQHQENKNCYFAVILLKYNFWQAKKAKAPLYADFERDVKYVALCEGDDYWTNPNKLQKQVDILDKHHDVNMCCHDFVCYFQHANRFEEASHYSLHEMPSGVEDFFRFTVKDHFHRYIVQTLTTMYRNGDYLQKIPARKYKFFRDQVFQYYLLKAGDGIALKECMGVYRKHKGGIATGITEERRIEIRLKVWYDIYQIEKEKDLYPIILWNGHELLRYTSENLGFKGVLGEIEFLYRELSFYIATVIVVNFGKSRLASLLKHK